MASIYGEGRPGWRAARTEGGGEGMAARRFFEQARALEQRIEGRRALIESLREMAERTTAQADGPAVSRSVDPHRVENLILRMVEAEGEIEADLHALGGVRREMGAVIAAVPDPELQTVLELRYVCGLPWTRIAGAMDCTLSNVYKLHRRALSAVDGVLKGSGL